MTDYGDVLVDELIALAVDVQANHIVLVKKARIVAGVVLHRHVKDKLRLGV